MTPSSISSLKHLMDRLFGGTRVRYECRDCGLKLDSGAEECPNCRSNEIAQYELW